jgi:hypothetical protein
MSSLPELINNPTNLRYIRPGGLSDNELGELINALKSKFLNDGIFYSQELLLLYQHFMYCVLIKDPHRNRYLQQKYYPLSEMLLEVLRSNVHNADQFTTLVLEEVDVCQI